MSANFLSLPRELRDKVYKLCLLHHEPVDPWSFSKYQRDLMSLFEHQREIALELFLANKIIHGEASSFFYGQNQFNFTMATSADVNSFIGTIGGSNAVSIHHIRISFPQFDHLKSGDVTLEENSTTLLESIQSGCGNLSTLTMSLYSSTEVEQQLTALDNPTIVDEALDLVNAQLRNISSLPDIIVEMYNNVQNSYVRSKFESYGWIIREREFPSGWDSDGSLGDFDDDWDRDYDDDDDDGDDAYDIDNDSDFWRRAGD